MKNIIPPINTPDGKFTDGDGSTIRGTPVTSTWLNNVQGATIDTQTELKNVIVGAGLELDANDQTQLLQAIQGLGGATKGLRITGIIAGEPTTTDINGSGKRSIVIGESVEASKGTDGAIVIGGNSKSSGSFSVAIGDNATVVNNSSIAIGKNTSSSNSNIAIGELAKSISVDNLAIGYKALTSNTKGISNIAIGNRSLSGDKVAGSNNIAIGTDALAMLESSEFNTAIGINSQKRIAINGRNTTCGYNTLSSTTKSNDMTAFGYMALANTTSGASSCAFGSESMKDAQPNSPCCAFGADTLKNTKASGCAFGRQALQENTTGSYNSAFGSYALQKNTTGGNNVAVGYWALHSNTSGMGNVAIGYSSLMENSTGSENVAIGYGSLVNSNGEWNTAVGRGALGLLDTGTDNVAIGGFSGGTIVSGSRNTMVGRSVAASSPDVTNCTILGYNAEVTGSNQVQLGNSETTTYVYGTVQNRSDLRDKADIEDTNLGLDFILKLRPVSFKWDYREDYKELVTVEDEDGNKKQEVITREKDGSKKRERPHQGFLAQEVKSVLDILGTDFGGYQDHSVGGGKDVLSLGYDEFIAPLTKAIQELHTLVLEQKEEITTLKNQLKNSL